MTTNNASYCLLLSTKTGYFRSPEGVRLINPDSTTACYTCLLTQRPYGPDERPVTPQSCGSERECFRSDQ